jgi:2',3'-cyclic-nucleotide 2'-phosphodiesterase (5'-nucleotidase family)
MRCKRLAALAVALLLLGSAAAEAAGGKSMDAAGTVPRLLTAVGDTDARSVECPMGDAVADAVRLTMKSDIAIVCGGDLAVNLQPGPITWEELRSAFVMDRPLATTTVTIRQLREILEAGLSHVRLNDSEKVDIQGSAYDGFPQISGITLFYDPSAQPGGRVHDIYLGDKRLNLDDDVSTVRLAATAFMLEGGYGLPEVSGAAPSDTTLADATARWLADGTADDGTAGKRLRTMGTADVPLSGALIAGVVIFALMLSWLRRKGSLKRFSNFER